MFLGKNFVMTGLPPPKLNFFFLILCEIERILYSEYCAIVLIRTYIHPFDRILDFSLNCTKLLNHHYRQTLNILTLLQCSYNLYGLGQEDMSCLNLIDSDNSAILNLFSQNKSSLKMAHFLSYFRALCVLPPLQNSRICLS